MLLATLCALTLTTTPDFAWLEGHWVRQTEAAVAEEVWLDPEGGVVLGLGRYVPENGRTSFEFMRIEEGETPVFIAQPSGREPTVFTLDEATDTGATFVNLDNEYPTHIRYARVGDTLHIQIWNVGEGPNGDPWVYRLRGE